MYQNRLGPSGGINYPNFVPCFDVVQLNLFLNNFDSQLTQAFCSAKEVTQFYKQNTARFCTYLLT